MRYGRVMEDDATPADAAATPSARDLRSCRQPMDGARYVPTARDQLGGRRNVGGRVDGIRGHEMG